MSTLTKESLITDAVDAVKRFHREQQGRAPEESQGTLVGDMFIVHSKGVFTPTEALLADNHDGRKLVQSARREQRALTRREIENTVAHVLGCEVAKSFYDLDVRNGEQIEIYMLGQNLEERFA